MTKSGLHCPRSARAKDVLGSAYHKKDTIHLEALSLCLLHTLNTQAAKCTVMLWPKNARKSLVTN